jgi:hypothetical protein
MIHYMFLQSIELKLIKIGSLLQFQQFDKISSQNGNIEICRQFHIHKWGIADNKISWKIFDLLFELAQSFAIVVELSGDIKLGWKVKLRINLYESDTLLIVWNFLQLHNLVVVVYCFLVNRERQHVDYVFVWVSEVKDASDLNVKTLAICLFAL